MAAMSDDNLQIRIKGANLRKVDVQSPEVAALLNGIKHTNADLEFHERYWKVRNIHVINNEQLNKSFLDFKNGLGDKTRKLEDYKERLVFSCETKKSVENICREGYVISKKKHHVLGHAGSGVHLVRNYDILTRFMAVHESSPSCFVMVHKAVLGKTKPIVPRVHKEDNYVKPYIGFDCHVSARRVVPDMPITDAYKCSHVFFYELDDVTSLPVRCPRQILPYAVLELVKKQQQHLENPFLAFGARKSQWEVKGETRRGYRFVLNKVENDSKQNPNHRKRHSEDMKTGLKAQLLEMRTRWPETSTLPKVKKLDYPETKSTRSAEKLNYRVMYDKPRSQKETFKNVKSKNTLKRVTKLHRLVRKLPLSMKPRVLLTRISSTTISNYECDDSRNECESNNEECLKRHQLSVNTQAKDLNERGIADSGKGGTMGPSTRTCDVEEEVNDENIRLTQTYLEKNHGAEPSVTCVTTPGESGQSVVAVTEQPSVAVSSNVTNGVVTETVKSADTVHPGRHTSPASKSDGNTDDTVVNMHRHTNKAVHVYNDSEMRGRAHIFQSKMYKIFPNVIKALSSETTVVNPRTQDKISTPSMGKGIPQIGFSQSTKGKHLSKSGVGTLRDPKHSGTMEPLVHHGQAPACQDTLNTGRGFLDTKQVIENFKTLSKTNLDALCLEAVETRPIALNNPNDSVIQNQTQNESNCKTVEERTVQSTALAETTKAMTANDKQSVNKQDTIHVHSVSVAQLPKHIPTDVRDLSKHYPVSCEENTSFFKPFLKVVDDRVPPKAEFKSVKSNKSNNFNDEAKQINDKMSRLVEQTVVRPLNDNKCETEEKETVPLETSVLVNPKVNAMRENPGRGNVTYSDGSHSTCSVSVTNNSNSSVVSQASAKQQVCQSISDTNCDKTASINLCAQATCAQNNSVSVMKHGDSLQTSGSDSTVLPSHSPTSETEDTFSSISKDTGPLVDRNESGNTSFFKTFLAVKSQTSSRMKSKDIQKARFDPQIFESVKSISRPKESSQSVTVCTTVKKTPLPRKPDVEMFDENTSIFKPFIAIKPVTKNTQAPYMTLKQTLPKLQDGERAIPSHSPPLADVAPSGLNTSPAVTAAKTDSLETKTSLFQCSTVDRVPSPKPNMHSIEAATVRNTSNDRPKSQQKSPTYSSSSHSDTPACQLDTKTIMLTSTKEKMDMSQNSPTSGLRNDQNEIPVHEDATKEQNAFDLKNKPLPDLTKADINPTLTQTLPATRSGSNEVISIDRDQESLETEDNPLKILKSGVIVDESTAQRVKQILFNQIAALQKKQHVQRKSKLYPTAHIDKINTSKDISSTTCFEERKQVKETDDLSPQTCKLQQSTNTSIKQSKLCSKPSVSPTSPSLQNTEKFFKSKKENTKCKDRKLEHIPSKESSTHQIVQTSSSPSPCLNENRANKQTLGPANIAYTAQERHPSLQVLEQLNSKQINQDSVETSLKETEQDATNVHPVIKTEPMETVLATDKQVQTNVIKEKSKQEESNRHLRKPVSGTDSGKNLDSNQQYVKVPEKTIPSQSKQDFISPSIADPTESVPCVKPMSHRPFKLTQERTESYQGRQQLYLPQHAVHKDTGKVQNDNISTHSAKNTTNEGKENKDNHDLSNMEIPLLKEGKEHPFALPKGGTIDSEKKNEPETNAKIMNSPTVIQNPNLLEVTVPGHQKPNKEAGDLEESDQAVDKNANDTNERKVDLSRNKTKSNPKPVTRMTKQECKSAIIQTLHELSDVLQILNSNSNATKETTPRIESSPTSSEAQKENNLTGERESSESHTNTNDTSLHDSSICNILIKTEPKDSPLLSESKQEDSLKENSSLQQVSETANNRGLPVRLPEIIQMKKEPYETPPDLVEEQSFKEHQNTMPAGKSNGDIPSLNTQSASAENNHLPTGNDKTLTVPSVRIPTVAQLVTCDPSEKETTGKTYFPVVFDVADGPDLQELEKFGIPGTYLSKRNTAAEKQSSCNNETTASSFTKQGHASVPESNTENIPVGQNIISNIQDTRTVNISSERCFSGDIPQCKERLTVCIKQADVTPDPHFPKKNESITSERKTTDSVEPKTAAIDSSANFTTASGNESEENGERNSQNSYHLRENQSSYSMGNIVDSNSRQTNNSKSVEASQHAQIISPQSSDQNRPKSAAIVFTFQEIKQMKTTQFRKYKMGLSNNKFIDFDKERHKKHSKHPVNRRNSENKGPMDFSTDKEHVTSDPDRSFEMASVKEEVVDCIEGENPINYEDGFNHQQSRPDTEIQTENMRSKSRAKETCVSKTKTDKARSSREKQKRKEETRTHRRAHTNNELDEPKISRTSFKKSGTGYFRWQNKYQLTPSKPIPDRPFVRTKHSVQTKEEFERWTRFKERENIRKNIEIGLREYRKTFEDTNCDKKGDEKVSTYLKSLTERLDFLQSKRDGIKTINNAKNTENEKDTCSGIVNHPHTRVSGREVFSDQPSSKQLHRDNIIDLSSTVRQPHQRNVSTNHTAYTENTDSITAIPNAIESSLTSTVESLIKETIAKKFAHLTDKLKTEICNELVDGNQNTSMPPYDNTKDVNQTSRSMFRQSSQYQRSHRERRYDNFERYHRSFSRDKFVCSDSRISVDSNERREQTFEDGKHRSRSRERPREFDTGKEPDQSRSRSRESSLYQRRGGSNDIVSASLERRESMSPKRDQMAFRRNRYRTRSPERTNECFEINHRRSPSSSTSSFDGYHQRGRSRGGESDSENYERRGYCGGLVDEHHQQRTSKDRYDNYRIDQQNMSQHRDTRPREWKHLREYSDFPENDKKHTRRSEELQYCQQQRRHSDWEYETNSCKKSNEYERREMNISNEFDRSYNSDDSVKILGRDTHEHPRVNSQNKKRRRAKIYSDRDEYLEDDTEVMYDEDDRNDYHFAHSKRPRSGHFHKTDEAVEPTYLSQSTFSRRQKRKFASNSGIKARLMLQANYLEDEEDDVFQYKYSARGAKRGTFRGTKRGTSFYRPRGISRGKQRGKRRGLQTRHFDGWKSRKRYTGTPNFDYVQVKSEIMSESDYEGDHAVEKSKNGYDAYQYRNKSNVISPEVTADRTHTLKTTHGDKSTSVKSQEHTRPESVKSKPESNESTITGPAMPIPTISSRFRGSFHNRGSRSGLYHKN